MSIFVTLISRLLIPFNSLLFVFGYIISLGIIDTEEILRISVSLFGCLTEQGCRLAILFLPIKSHSLII